MGPFCVTQPNPTQPMGQPMDNSELEPVLRRFKNTAPACDGIPAWVYRSCSFELADVIADIFGCSFSTGMVPVSWVTAIVTPGPKVSHPLPFQISVLYPLHRFYLELLTS